MAKFMLLLYGGSLSTMSPLDLQRAVQSYYDWSAKLREQNRLVDGNGLETDGKIIQPGAKPLVTDGHFAESKEVIAGYYAIEAKDLEEASQVALECPHLLHGGLVHVRPLMHGSESAA